MQVDYEKLTGDWCQWHRRDRGWTQEELAARLAELGEPIHATAVTRLEKGSRSVRLNEWVALLRVFEQSGESFFDYVRTRLELGQELDLQLARLDDEPPSLLEVAQSVETITGLSHKMIREAIARARSEDVQHQEAD